MTQLLSNPELMSLIGASRAPAPVAQSAPPPANPAATGIGGRIRTAVTWAGQKLSFVKEACSHKVPTLRPWLLGLCQLLLAVAGAACFVAYSVGPLAAGLLGAVAGCSRPGRQARFPRCVGLSAAWAAERGR